MGTIKGIGPKVVVIDMESSDACEKDSDSETIASSLVAFTELVISECKLQFIAVRQILPRKPEPPFEEYNDCVRQINTLVNKALLHIKQARFWHHRGLSDPSAAIYLADGVHLNEGGNRALYKSYSEDISDVTSSVMQYLWLSKSDQNKRND